MKKVSARKSDKTRKRAKTKKSPKIRLILGVLPLLIVASIVLGMQNNGPEEQSSQGQSGIEQITATAEDDLLTAEDEAEQSDPKSTKSRKKTSTQNQKKCTQTEIPFKTVYQHVPHIQKGKTEEKAGRNGSSLDCGDGKPVVLSPVDKIIYVGTGLTDAEIEQKNIEAQQEYDRIYMLWVQTRTTAYQNCMNGIPVDYPSRESYCTNQATQQAGPPPQRP